MRRGFKTWAEKIALEQRRELKIRVEEPLAARILAKHYRIQIIDPSMVPELPNLVKNHLLTDGSDNWSAVTLVHERCILIIHNPNHSPHRQESDLMHELAHILCGHTPSRLLQLNGLPSVLREYDCDKEEEAVWLGGCLQLPRPAILWAMSHGMDNKSMADYYNASVDLVRYRRQITGVDSQFNSHRSF